MDTSAIPSVVILEAMALLMGSMGVARYRRAKTMGQRRLARLLILMAAVLLIVNPIRLFV